MDDLRQRLEDALTDLEEAEECGDLEDRMEAATKVANIQSKMEQEKC
jgi:hypothetical protein